MRLLSCVLLLYLIACSYDQAVPESLLLNTSAENKNLTEIRLIINNSNQNNTLEKFEKNTLVSEVQAKYNHNKFTLFAYQLQNAKYETLLSHDSDLLILDPDDASFSKKQINELQQKKTVLAYLSIGEAEDYRDYWRSYWQRGDPDWLHAENPEWKGNYKVRYWYPEWQKIIEQYTAEILLQGYSGLYLDVIDAYEYWEYENEANARQLMIDFVKKISLFARAINPSALVFVQNGEELLSDSEYLSIIDGIGREDVWFNDDRRVSAEDTQQVISYLDSAKSANKIVLIIDYPTEKKKRCEVIKNSQQRGFLAYTPTRELDKVVSVTC